MGNTPKPNFKPYGNKKPATPKPATPSKKVGGKTHHDSLKGGGGNNTGRR